MTRPRVKKLSELTEEEREKRPHRKPEEKHKFWAAFLDMEDERPDAYFWHEEHAKDFLVKYGDGSSGDVIPFYKTSSSWTDNFYGNREEIGE